MQYTEEEPEKGESDKYAGLGIGVAGLLAENLACHPFIILRRQCQVGENKLKKRKVGKNSLWINLVPCGEQQSAHNSTHPSASLCQLVQV